MIGLLVHREGEADLEVNLQAAEKAELEISAQKLEPSDIVKDNKRRG